MRFERRRRVHLQMEKRCSEGLSLLEDALMEENEGLKLATSLEISNPDDALKSTKAKIGEVREENKKLKQLLERFVKDYQSLQKLFYQVLEQEQSKKAMKTEKTDDQMVSLCLGRTLNEVRKDVKKNIDQKKEVKIDGELELALNLKFDPGLHEIGSKNQSSETRFEEMKEEDGAEILAPPRKTMKTMKRGENEDSQLKKTRVSVRARCESSTMNDGCQWRKYGQKIAKGNPCPRAYYRCTVSPSCPVRKHVQRCVDDMSILITTYEGTHNHPLSLSATAMASATSAAVYSSSISSTFSNSHPTITIDLTSESKPLSIFSGSYPSSFQTPWNGNGRSPVQEHFYPPPYKNNDKQFSTFSATNPGFQTALAAALKSVVRNGVDAARENHGGKEAFSLEFNGFIIKNDSPIGGLNQNQFAFGFTEH